FIEDKDKWDNADFFLYPLFKTEGFVEGGLARAVGDEEVAGRAAQIGPAHLLVIVLAVDVPEDQREVGSVHLHFFLVDLDADGGLVDVRVDALDESPDETRLPHSEGPEHADFFLEHGPELVGNGSYANIHTAIVLPVGFG